MSGSIITGLLTDWKPAMSVKYTFKSGGRENTWHLRALAVINGLPETKSIFFFFFLWQIKWFNLKGSTALEAFVRVFQDKTLVQTQSCPLKPAERFFLWGNAAKITPAAPQWVNNKIQFHSVDCEEPQNVASTHCVLNFSRDKRAKRGGLWIPVYIGVK